MTDDDDEEARKLLEQWGSDDDSDNKSEEEEEEADEGSGDDLEDMVEKVRREVTPVDMSIDHVLLGCSDLADAMVMFEEMTSVKPFVATSLNGCGVKSARVAFEDCSFLEIVGPDPDQKETPLRTSLSELEPGKLVPLHFAIANSEADTLRKGKWKEMGLKTDKITMVAKDRGMPWKYTYYVLLGHDDAGMVPFFIDWGGSIHAAGRLPVVGKRGKLIVSAPDGCAVHELTQGIDGVFVGTGEKSIEFSFDSANGTHTFKTDDPIGISFPM